MLLGWSVLGLEVQSLGFLLDQPVSNSQSRAGHLGNAESHLVHCVSEMETKWGDVNGYSGLCWAQEGLWQEQLICVTDRKADGR